MRNPEYRSKHHGLDLWAVPAEGAQLACGIEDPLDLLIVERQRGILLDLRGLDRHRRVSINPSGVTPPA
jgi:hypothetical protein